MIDILYAANPDQYDSYHALLSKELDQLGQPHAITDDQTAHAADYIIYAPSSTLQDFTPYFNCKAVLNTWAGVEQVTHNATLTQPLCRMVDPGMTQGMVEWVVGHVMRHHLNLDAYSNNPDKTWDPTPPPLATERQITILGLGALGGACAQALAALGFQVTGWSRSPKKISGVSCLSDKANLDLALKNTDILVLLVPDTPATQGMINADRLALLPKGAHILNPARGTLIDDDALLAALNTGHIAKATLDVFTTEPLPQDHAYWTHPAVTVTPHIGSATRERTAAQVLAENIHRGETGAPFLHVVDRAAGY